MTREEILNAIKIVTHEKDDDLLSAYLDIATGIVRNKAYPFGDGTETVPAKYDHVVINVATYLLAKVGAEGETTHNENGVNRSWSSSYVPNQYLKEVMPMAALPKNAEEEAD